jgi:hypothetical protein
MNMRRNAKLKDPVRQAIWSHIAEKCEDCASDDCVSSGRVRSRENPVPRCIGDLLNTGCPCSLYHVKPWTAPKQMYRAIRSECHFCLNGNRPEYCGVESACSLYKYLTTKYEDVVETILKKPTRNHGRIVNEAQCPKAWSVKREHEGNAMEEVRANEGA